MLIELLSELTSSAAPRVAERVLSSTLGGRNVTGTELPGLVITTGPVDDDWKYMSQATVSLDKPAALVALVVPCNNMQG